MISKEQEEYILEKAYVPEHIPKMMSFLSEGECFLFEQNYVIFKTRSFLIFIGYPLNFTEESDQMERCLKRVLKTFGPLRLFILTGKGESKFFKKCKKIDDDFYYVIDIERISFDRKLLKLVERAQKRLSIQIEKNTTPQHRKLTEDFLQSKNLSDNIKELYIRLPEYMNFSDGIFYLSAYSEEGQLAGYYVVDTEAKNFSAYMIGCLSKVNYVPYTSDYLMYELIKITEKMGKKYVNLGIGVNEGIRRFKEKWGGLKFLKYAAYECRSFSSILFGLFGIRV